MRAQFYTLGCKVNQYETEAMKYTLAKAGFETGPYILGEAVGDSVVIVNSCTVTAESDRKLRQLLRRCRRENPACTLVVTGCMPQAFPEKAAELTEADVVLGNARRSELLPRIQAALAEKRRQVAVTDHTADYEPLFITTFEEHTRAFVKIQDGCNRFCSYCIIPYARGRVRSRPLDDLKRELEALAQNGYREVVLVGINLTAYGQDIGLSLCDAVETACAVEDIARVRLGSLEPDMLTSDVIARLATQKKLCPQFHVALQSGCDETLKRMRRRYDTAEYRAVCQNLRAAFPDCALTTDVMVGFAGESDAEFAASLAFVKELGFAKVHTFAYSRRDGTPAAKMQGQVTAAEKSRRSREMIAVADKTAAAYAASWVGRETTVLAETPQPDGTTVGYTPAYLPTTVNAAVPAGETVRVKIVRADGEQVFADLLC
ncbi:MAG: tRNA (N(6)-L-threonylcarbamoyladenosine(37)-C(2))-methylthiotransferase MtaB [Clostridia bacterium]|nr:tRNA (N(6)-L-threonylcarbamoyladenosine(37)-C(2))-methylthiotransferase MtaB [Clostridia bacterium]